MAPLHRFPPAKELGSVTVSPVSGEKMMIYGALPNRVSIGSLTVWPDAGTAIRISIIITHMSNNDNPIITDRNAYG